jgi:hypothetical protein
MSPRLNRFDRSLIDPNSTTAGICLTSALGPDCVKTRMLRFAGAAGWLMKPSLCSDRFYQSANAENAHDPFHVVGQDV